MIGDLHWNIVPRMTIIYIGKEITVIDRIKYMGKHCWNTLLRSQEIDVPAKLRHVASIDEWVVIEKLERTCARQIGFVFKCQ